MGLFRDARHAVRSLRRTPTFTVVALVTLTLAVVANTTAFTLLNALMWRDVAVRDPHTLVQVSTIGRSGTEAGVSWPMLRELRRRDGELTTTLGWLWNSVVKVETGTSTIGQAGLAGVTGDFYRELGVVPALGRLIGDEDLDVERDIANPVAVISWSFWQRAYGGSPAAIGQQLRAEDVPLTIVGVTPPGFKGLGLVFEPDVTAPLSLLSSVLGGEGQMKSGESRWIQATGRLRPGVTLDEARARLRAAWPALLERTMPSTFAGAERDAFLALRLSVTSAAHGVERPLRREYARPLHLVLAIALVIAVIAAVNLCALSLARAGARIHEVRVRLALGASRLQIVREAALEGLVLGIAAATASVALAGVLSDAVVRLILEEYLVPVDLNVAADGRVVAVALAIALSAGVLMSLVPAWSLSRDGLDGIARSSQRTVARSGRAGRRLLIVQVALSVVLLVASALLVRSLQRIVSTETGLSSDVLVGFPRPAARAYRGVDPETYYQRTLERLAAIPGVHAVAFTQHLPAGGPMTPEPVARAGTATSDGSEASSTLAYVSPGFLDALGIPLLQGRDFTWADTTRSRRVAIVSRSLAERLFGPGAGIGEHIRVGVAAAAQDVEVVGIAGDARVYDVRNPNLYTAYLTSLQLGANANWKAVVLRGSHASMAAVREVFTSIGVETLPRMMSLQYVSDRTVLSEWLLAMLATSFGGLVVILAAIGINGQMAYLVSLQRKEIGIRIALGAGARRIVGWIIGSGLGIGLAGTAIGLVASVPAVRLLRRLLVDTSPYDVPAFTLAPLLLLAAIVAACLVPALRASTVDPVVELRRD